MGAKLENAGRKVAVYIAIFIGIVLLFKLAVGAIKGLIFTLVLAALAVLALVILNWGLGSKKD
jgi:hypothetical protein